MKMELRVTQIGIYWILPDLPGRRCSFHRYIESRECIWKNWIPAECDVSIRPGWFYHQQEDDKVKTPAQLFDLYLKSVGRGAHLLLNVPPDRRGLINEHDSISLVGFKKLRDESFGKNLAKQAKAYFIPHDGMRAAPG